MAVHIDRYGFGSITVDGETYRKDLFILRGEITSPWWRDAGGHVFAPADLEPLIEAAPDVVVLGTGYFGLVKVLDGTRAAFTAAGTELVVGKTGQVVERFNQLADAGRDVAAALHLTC
jgi:hypothetical protein